MGAWCSTKKGDYLHVASEGGPGVGVALCALVRLPTVPCMLYATVAFSKSNT